MEVLHTLNFDLSYACPLQNSSHVFSNIPKRWKKVEGKSKFSFINDNQFNSNQMNVEIMLYLILEFRSC